MLLGEGREALRHADLRRRRHGFDVKPLRHREPVPDILVTRRANVHVVPQSTRSSMPASSDFYAHRKTTSPRLSTASTPSAPWRRRRRPPADLRVSAQRRGCLYRPPRDAGQRFGVIGLGSMRPGPTPRQLMMSSGTVMPRRCTGMAPNGSGFLILGSIVPTRR